MSYDWPNGAKAAISFSLDNLGEAQDVNKGTWPVDKPYGQHPAVTQTLPRILDMLDEVNIKATYFAEAWSLDKYPAAIKSLLNRGHEVAWHGYQHEVWAAQTNEQMHENFEKSFKAARQAGVTYRGFRPPGGNSELAPMADLLKKHGVSYLSPLAPPLVSCDGGGLQIIPFTWRSVDAFYYMDKFADIRELHGARREVLSPAECKAGMMTEIDDAIRSGQSLSVIFHPFLTTSEEKFIVMREVMERISRDEKIWTGTCEEIAKWMSKSPTVLDSS